MIFAQQHVPALESSVNLPEASPQARAHTRPGTLGSYLTEDAREIVAATSRDLFEALKDGRIEAASLVRGDVPERFRSLIEGMALNLLQEHERAQIEEAGL